MTPLTDYETGFLEAHIDTDGSISLHRRRNRPFSWNPELAFTNTCPELLEKLRGICQGGFMNPQRSVRQKSDKGPLNKKPLYRYVVSKTRMREILPQLTLVKKERQRILMIEALGMLRRGKRHSEAEVQRLLEIHRELGQLNEKGRKFYD